MLPTLRDATEADFPEILALNAKVSQFTSPLAMDRLTSMHSVASYRKVACIDGDIVGFLIAMRAGDAYENPNFKWFTARHDLFVYVDRVVVSEACAGMKLGSLFYRDLFGYAQANDLALVACEYYIKPPNERSRHFHNKFGFEQVGVRVIEGTGNEVSMQVAIVAAG